MKYANILQQLGTIDNGFSYNVRVGTLEFQTQNSSHNIQVMARTLLGNYSKTFPGLNLLDAATADTSRVMPTFHMFFPASMRNIDIHNKSLCYPPFSMFAY